MSEEKAVEVLPEKTELPSGVAPSPNYLHAVELGHVLAKSGYFPEAREASKAAVRVMIAMDLGLSPVAGLMGIHTLEKSGRITFLIESKLLGALVKRHPVYGYKVIERSDTSCTLEFSEGGKPIDDGQKGRITYTIQNAARAGLDTKPSWKSNPRDMLTWRTLAEGVRLYFPDLLAGGAPIYADAEFGEDVQELKLREALEPAKPPALADEKAKALGKKARKVKDEIDAINPGLVLADRFQQKVASAEHSHEALENVIAGYEYIRDCEREFADLSETLSSSLSASEHKALVERARRRGSPQERVDVLKAALPGVEDKPQEEAKPDAE